MGTALGYEDGVAIAKAFYRRRTLYGSFEEALISRHKNRKRRKRYIFGHNPADHSESLTIRNDHSRRICERRESICELSFLSKNRLRIGIEDIAESLFRFARKNRLDNLPGNIDIDDYACVRENLGLIVISEERNRDYLAGIVYEQIEDLALVPIIFTKDDNGIGNIKISRDFLQMWGLSAEDVMRDARERAPHVMPLTFRQLNEMVGDKEENGEELFVLSNCYFAGGAAVVFYPHVLECIGMALGRDLYLLPSSINEMIAITDNGQDPERLYEIVREVNRTQVSEADLLTDAVYYYKRDLNSFRRVRPA
jgi:hypothetical protein